MKLNQTLPGKMFQVFMSNCNMDQITIINFEEYLSSHFKDLNVAWLEKYFYVESIDIALLANPKKNIIEKGGHIFFAKVNDCIAGTVALLKTNDSEFELGKMAVDEKYQGKKIGHRLIEYCLQKSKEYGAKKIILYSNTILEPAIHLYEKFGFRQTPINHSEYKRSNIKMEKLLT